MGKLEINAEFFITETKLRIYNEWKAFDRISDDYFVWFYVEINSVWEQGLKLPTFECRKLDAFNFSILKLKRKLELKKDLMASRKMI